MSTKEQYLLLKYKIKYKVFQVKFIDYGRKTEEKPIYIRRKNQRVKP